MSFFPKTTKIGKINIYKQETIKLYAKHLGHIIILQNRCSTIECTVRNRLTNHFSILCYVQLVLFSIENIFFISLYHIIIFLLMGKFT